MGRRWGTRFAKGKRVRMGPRGKYGDGGVNAYFMVLPVEAPFLLKVNDLYTCRYEMKRLREENENEDLRRPFLHNPLSYLLLISQLSAYRAYLHDGSESRALAPSFKPASLAVILSFAVALDLSNGRVQTV
jgi:hypothetical protein